MDAPTIGKDLLIFAHRGEASHFLNTFTPLKNAEGDCSDQRIGALNKATAQANAIPKLHLGSRWFYRFKQADVLLVGSDGVEIQQRIESTVSQLQQSLGDVYCLGTAGVLGHCEAKQSFSRQNATKALGGSASLLAIGQAIFIRSVYRLDGNFARKSDATASNSVVESTTPSWPKRRCFSVASAMATHDCITVNHGVTTTNENRYLAQFADAVDTELYAIVQQLSQLKIVPYCIKVISDRADETTSNKHVKENAHCFSKMLYRFYRESREQVFSNDSSAVLNLKTISNRTGYQQYLHSWFDRQSKKVISQFLQTVSISLTHSQNSQAQAEIVRKFFHFFFATENNNSNFQREYLFARWQIFIKHIKDDFLNHIVPILKNERSHFLEKKLTDGQQKENYKTKRRVFLKWIAAIDKTSLKQTMDKNTNTF